MKPNQPRNNTFLWLCIASIIGVAVWNPSVVSASSRCYRLSAKGFYMQAAHCFRKAAGRISKHAKDKFARGLRGNLLRNSAMSFLKATQQSKREEVRAYRAEQTVKMIRWLLRENLCSGALHCSQLRQEAQKIESTIPYKRLRVSVPPGKRAKVIIRGYRFYATHEIDKLWTRKVRPGQYVIEYRYATEKPRHYRVKVGYRQRQKRAVVVMLPPPQPPSRSVVSRIARVLPQKAEQPQKAKLAVLKKQVKPVAKPKAVAKKAKLAVVKRSIDPLRQAPPVAKKPSMVGPLVLLGVGGAAMAAGGILLGMGYSGAQQLQQEADVLRTQSGTRSQADQIASAKAGQSAGALSEKYSSLGTQTTTGWVVASSGAAMGVASMIWLLMQRTAPTRPHPQSHTLFKTKASH